MNRSEIHVSDLQDFQSLARLLSDPQPEGIEITHVGELSIRLGRHNISHERVIQELTNAFQANTWVTKLTLSARDPENLLPILELTPLLSNLDSLLLFGPLGAAHAQCIESLVGPPTQLSLRSIEFILVEFQEDFVPTWNALRRSDTLERVGLTHSKVDTTNVAAFENCFQNTEKVLVLGNTTFADTPFGGLVADILVHATKLKLLHLQPDMMHFSTDGQTREEQMTALITGFEPLVTAMKRQVDACASFPKLKLTLYHDEMLALVTDGLHSFTNLRDLDLQVSLVPVQMAAMKTLLAALKQNGSLYSASFTYYSPNLDTYVTYGETFQNAVCQRNERVPELLHEARKQEEKPHPIVQDEDPSQTVQEDVVPKALVPTLAAAGMQSRRMAATTLVAAFTSWDRLGSTRTSGSKRKAAPSSDDIGQSALTKRAK